MKKEFLQTLSLSKKIVQVTDNEKKRLGNALYCPCQAVGKEEFNSEKLNEFLDSMHSIMHRESGIGLAANQVGRNIQIFIIEAMQKSARYSEIESVPYQIFINPKITSASKERKNFWHGCLSARSFRRGNVATYEWIEYEAFDSEGNKKTGRLKGLASVIFQHEFRHLLGKTYVDFAKEFCEQEELEEKIKKGQVNRFERCEDSVPLLLNDYKIGDSLEEYYIKTIKIKSLN